MNIAIDTNVLVRFIIADDEAQYVSALQLFQEATSITIPTVVLCETVWVLRGYKIDKKMILEQISTITQTEKMIVADDEVKAGLDLMAVGGDFADGVAAYTGRRLSPDGKAAFASFDNKAVGTIQNFVFRAFWLITRRAEQSVQQRG